MGAPVHDGAPLERAESTAVATSDRPNGARALAATEFGAHSMQQLLHFAIERGTPVEQLEKLVDLAERMERRDAAREFAAAMAAFQAECPSIKKSSTANVATKSGGEYSYTYAELDEIARVVNPILAKHGLSYGWDSTVTQGALTCVCTVRHQNGHAATSSMTLPIENPSAMNPQQKVGAAMTFAQRRTLSAALGLTTTDADTDARELDPTVIGEDQVIELEDLLLEVGANREKFLKFMGVDATTKIRATEYHRATAALRRIGEQRTRAQGDKGATR